MAATPSLFPVFMLATAPGDALGGDNLVVALQAEPVVVLEPEVVVTLDSDDVSVVLDDDVKIEVE